MTTGRINQVSSPYLALDGIHRPIWAAFPNNPTRRQCLVVRQGPGTTGLSPSPAPPSRGLGPGYRFKYSLALSVTGFVGCPSRALRSHPSGTGGGARAECRSTPPTRTPQLLNTFAGSFCCASFDNDPSTGSPTETLLRFLLPLNDKVQWTSRDVAGSEPPTSTRSEHFTGSFNRQIAPPTKNGHAPPPIESRKSSQSVNPYYVWTCRIPLIRTSSELAVRRAGKAPEGTIPSPSPGLLAATRCRRGISSNSSPTTDGFGTGAPVPSPQSQSYSQTYGSIWPTSLAYTVSSTRSCSPWRPDVVISTTGCGRHSVLQIFKGCWERTGNHATCGALPAAGPYLRLSRFQGGQAVKQKR
ncbi:Protein TAR1 [Capsicum baccatum]|uniref:Protein TAR1 n=1 Tax=Capsicum baccatum TaxID=33114 RepID=A0A2G2UXE9_CAPBA|nr:Protein TAR1 [Capsicum baccatum]